MATPQPAIMIPRELVHHTVALETKPSASMHYTLARGRGSENGSLCLVVFLNGLMTDKSTWLPVMAGIIRQNQNAKLPSLLAYDRFGQGLTDDRDPQDQGHEAGRGHDVGHAAEDLHQLIIQICRDKLGTAHERLSLIFVANSIGCVIARLYAERHPGSVAALLLLDSMMANSNFDWWPDPDSKDFDPDKLPTDVSVEVLRQQRAKLAAIFAPDVVNKEGLDRRNVSDLLPYSDRPQLSGPGGRRPLVTVAEHDPERFASESLKSMGTPTSLSLMYTQPLWQRYNQELLKITDADRATGPIVARDCGHFIQRDDPAFVVQQLASLLTDLGFWR